MIFSFKSRTKFFFFLNISNFMNFAFILNKSYFEWSFHPNFFRISMLIFAEIQWQGEVMSFDSYRETQDLYGCHKRRF